MPIISKDIWITREGEQIEIKHMASSHLLATIHFIENRRFMNVAEVYTEQQMKGDNRLNAMGYYIQWPIQYETMIEEAIRRHLILRGSAQSSQGVIIREVEKKIEPQQVKRLEGRRKK